MQKISQKEKFTRYERILSLENDPYLESHCLGNMPFFPFVMGMEFFCQVCNFLQKTDQTISSILFKDFILRGAIILRKKRSRKIFVDVYELDNVDQTDRICMLNEEEDVFIEGRLSKRSILREEERNPFDKRFLERDGSWRIGKALYDGVLPHGPHFHNRFEIICHGIDEVLLRQHGILNSLTYFDDESLEDLYLNPALLDGVLQTCALHGLYYHQLLLLPLSVQSVFVDLKKVKKVSEVFVKILPLDRNVFDVFVYDEASRKVVIELRQMQFSILEGHRTPDIPPIPLGRNSK